MDEEPLLGSSQVPNYAHEVNCSRVGDAHNTYGRDFRIIVKINCNLLVFVFALEMT